MLRRSLGLLGLRLLSAVPSLAQLVPPPLQGWQDWVLHDVPQHGCPFLANQMPHADSYPCAWPGELILDAGADGATFSMTVHVDAPDWITLPGDSRHWPQQVTVNRETATVLQRAGVPALRLAPGDYQLVGKLPWTNRPARLRVPAAVGLIKPTFNLMQIGIGGLTLVPLRVLISALPSGSLGLPDMPVAGNGSSAWNLRWFADRVAGLLPSAGVISVLLWVYKIAMLAWALWLANALIGWLRWGFDGWTRGGYWRKREPKVAPPMPTPSLEPANNA